MLCTAIEHSLLQTGSTPADWGSNLGPGPGSRLPQLPFTSRSGPLPCGPERAPTCFVSVFFFPFTLVSNLVFMLVRMRLISRSGCCGGNRVWGGDWRLCQRCKHDRCGLGMIPANQIWEGLNQVSRCIWALLGSFRMPGGNIYVRIR